MENSIESYKQESIPPEKYANSGSLDDNSGVDYRTKVSYLQNSTTPIKVSLEWPIYFWKLKYRVNQIAVINLTRVGLPSALSRNFSGSDKRYWAILDLA